MLSPKVEVTTPVTAVSDTETDTVVVNAETSTTPLDEGFLPQKNIDESTIVLDGPLSQVYTNALNQLYAKENYTTTEVGSDLEKVPFKPHSNARYIYTITGTELEHDAYVDAFESFRIASEHWKETYVCVEHNLDITPRVAAFLAYARENGATILNDRVHALEFLSDKLNK